MLTAMNRLGDSKMIRENIAKLRTIPGIDLRSTVIVGFPGETEEDFAELCQFIKENSPFKMTIVATKANGENGYFPSAFAFDVSGGYECDTTKYIRGTAERLADTYVELLTAQFNNK